MEGDDARAEGRVGRLGDSAGGGLGVEEDMEALVNEVEKLSVSLDIGPALSLTVSEDGGLLLGSLYSIRPFTPRALERMMVSLWKPVYGASMVERGPNLMLFSFGSKVDMTRVIDEGPWRFDDHVLLLKEILDPAQADREILRGLPIWIQIHNVLYAWLTRAAAAAIGEKLGTVLKVDENSEGLTGLGFLRVRVEIDVADPLPRKMNVVVGKSSFWVQFKFEKLPNFCYKCGMLDHIEMYCKKPPVKDEKGVVQVWDQELRGFPPRRQNRLPIPHQPKPPAFQRDLGRTTPASMTLALAPVAHPGFESGRSTGREPFKRKRITRQASSAGMEGIETGVSEAHVAGK